MIIIIKINFNAFLFSYLSIKGDSNAHAEFLQINDEKKLTEIKTSNMPNSDSSRPVDESLPKKIETILEFLIKINNQKTIETR